MVVTTQPNCCRTQPTTAAYAPSAQSTASRGRAGRRPSRALAPSRSCTSAGNTTSPQSRPRVSTSTCRLRPAIFFPRVVAPGTAALGRLDRLAVDHGGAGRRLAVVHPPHVGPQDVVDLLPQAPVPPGVEVIGNGLPRREVVGEHPPGAAAAGQVEGGVDDLAQGVGAGPAGAGARLGEQVFDVDPLQVGQIAGVTHPCFHAGSLPARRTRREGRFLDALLLAGALAVAHYLGREVADEFEVRELADALYRRADWQWAQNGEATVTHGWRPESGFIPHRWEGYDEGLLLYVLGLGSPTHPLPSESYAAYCATYRWKQLYGRELLYSGPLFTHQLSHLWIDFRGLRDAFMRERGSDYFENSRQSTYVQQAYAVHNPMQFDGYGEHCWGFTACDGPGWVKRVVNGVERQFFDYIARGAPFGPDDGTVAPWVVLASLPFAPEIVIPTTRHLAGLKLGGKDRLYGFKASFNPTFRVEDSDTGWWVTPYQFGF